MNNTWELNLPDHRELNWSKGWEVKRLDAMIRNLKSSDIVYDIGAEEGDITALLAKKSKGICIIEPSPKFWPNIRLTFEANNLDKPIKCFAGFASSKTELNPLMNNVKGEINNGWPECSYDTINEEVGFRHLAQEFDATPQIKLDDFQNNYPDGNIPMPDLINIDVEGSELQVLKGARNILETGNPIIFVSIHPTAMKDFWWEKPDDLYDFMESLYYDKHFITVDHEIHVVFWKHSKREYIK